MQIILANASKNMFSPGQISNFFLQNTGSRCLEKKAEFRSYFQTKKDRGWWKHDSFHLWKIRWTKIDFAILSHKKRGHTLDLPLRPVIDSLVKKWACHPDGDWRASILSDPYPKNVGLARGTTVF